MYHRLEAVKQHVQERKEMYLGVAGGITVGIVGTLLVKDSTTAVAFKETYLIGFKYKSPNIVLTALGDPGNVVQCIETGTIWASQGQAARELGVSATNIGNHLHGKVPDIKGLHLEVLGKAGQPLAK